MKGPASRRPRTADHSGPEGWEVLLRRIEENEAASKRAWAALSSSVEEAADRIAARLERLEARAEFAIEASLLAAASLEGDIAALQARTERRAAPSNASGEDLRELAGLLGARFAELEHRIEARLARTGDADAPAFAPAAEDADGRSNAVWRVRPLPEIRALLAATHMAAPAASDPRPIRPEAPPVPRSDVVLHAEDIATGWEKRFWPSGSAALGPAGEVRAGGTGEFGIVSRRYPFAGEAIAEIEVEIAGMVGIAGSPRLMLLSGEGERMGPDIPLEGGATGARFTIPFAVSDLKFKVVAEAAEPGARFALRSARIVRCDPDRHRERVRASVGEPVLASLASIPQRRTLLRDCVASLLPQCDEVRVFLNGYEDVPDFLEHPRIEVRRSQDFDDRGDAGKMFWIDRDRDRPGYRLIADDDLIFPPDFAETMCGRIARHANRAVFGAHGVLLRQPFERYYDPQARAATLHFAGALSRDRAVHLLGTGTLAFHSSQIDAMPADFMFRNSADVWFREAAERNGMALVSVARPAHWIREHAARDAAQTIYGQSRGRTGSRFDSSAIQDAVLKRAAPLTIRVPNAQRRAIALVLETAGTAETALAALAGLDPDAEWVVLLAFDRSDRDLEALVAARPIPHETHLVDSGGDGAKGEAGIRRLAKRLSLRDIEGLVPEEGVPPETSEEASPPASKVNALFERVLVLNLDRRPDRLASVLREMEAAGIRAERHAAVDGQAEAIGAEYEAYARTAPVTVSPLMPQIRFSEDLYMRYESQNQRVAHLEAEGRKAIGSAGAWGYLRSYEQILERAIADRVDSLLVFDDDVMLHRDLPALFAEAAAELPEDWLILQLGTLQYNWSPPWAQWRSPLLYQTNGSAVGSHAVGMRFAILPFLLDQTRRMDMPFDIGALSAATRAFADRCFVIHPNLAIQRLADTDIGTSAFQERAGAAAAAATYRWDLSAYGALPRAERAGGGTNRRPVRASGGDRPSSPFPNPS